MVKRLIGSFLIVLICVPVIMLGGIYFEVFCGTLGLLALKEIIDLKKHHEKIPKYICFISIILMSIIIFSSRFNEQLLFDYSYIPIALTILFILIPSVFYDEKYSSRTAIYLLSWIIFIGIFFNSLVLIRETDINYLIYLLLIACLNDVFAYVVGKLLGTHKCSPKISPNKTWEGTIGGLVLGSIIASIFYLNFISSINIFKIFMITIILAATGTCGDLVLSKIKRENEIKDFSNIIIGHGGILDRIDSLIFITYTATILLNFI